MLSLPASAHLLMCNHRGVICFTPAPYTTQGEARKLALLMKEHHWATATVITSTPHILRTRMRMSWCVGNQAQVVGRSNGLSWGDWIYQYGYQTLGFAKAFFVTPGC